LETRVEVACRWYVVRVGDGGSTCGRTHLASSSTKRDEKLVGGSERNGYMYIVTTSAEYVS
jgi:hypothetical protein